MVAVAREVADGQVLITALRFEIIGAAVRKINFIIYFTVLIDFLGDIFSFLKQFTSGISGCDGILSGGDGSGSKISCGLKSSVGSHGSSISG